MQGNHLYVILTEYKYIITTICLGRFVNVKKLPEIVPYRSFVDGELTENLFSEYRSV